jgi:phage/plasmid-associated DNA primase
MNAHVFTWLRWYNSAPDYRGQSSKVVTADIGPYDDIPYGTTRTSELHAKDSPPHPEYGQWQWGISCSKTSRTLVIDVDDYDEYVASPLEVYLPAGNPTSFRLTDDGSMRLHYVVVVPEELLSLWPKQGPRLWGDVKSKGFSYITGVHSSGSSYVAAASELVYADEELMEAINAEPRVTGQGSATGGSAGPWTAEGYAYADGEKHTRGVADVASMVSQGMPDETIQGLMTDILQRSENYAGHGEEVEGWIASARSKFNLAEGESWSSQLEEAHYQQLTYVFGDEGFARIMARVAVAQAEWASKVAPVEYVRNPQEWITAQVEAAAESGEWHVPQIPSLENVPLENLLYLGEPVEPLGTSDTHLADLFIATVRDNSERADILALAADSGGWIRNWGHTWREWGSKSDAKSCAEAAVAAWAMNLKTIKQVTSEEETRTQFYYEEWQARKSAGTLTEEELADPPSFEMDEERIDRLKKNRARLHSSAGVSAVASMVMNRMRSNETVRISDLDADPSVIWAGGAAYSLLDTELTVVPQVQQEKHLKSCVCAPVPGPHPLWDEALAALFPNPEIRQWAVRELAGAALWGETSKENPVLDGKPNAGKSTVTDTIRKILGNYAVDIDPDKLIGGRDSSSAEEEKAAMIGARMVLLDEPPKRDKQSISQFNRLASGTGEISASAKYKGRVSAPKRFNMVINQNPKQNRMKLEAEGVKQRLVFIPAEGEISRELYKRFTAGIRQEYPAILATLIRECAQFHTGNRMPMPVAAQVVLDTATADADEFPQWLWENYELPQGDVTKVDEDKMPGFDPLRKAYAEHCRSVPGVFPLTRQQLRERLDELGIKVRDFAGTSGKRRNVVLVKPLPLVQAMHQY